MANAAHLWAAAFFLLYSVFAIARHYRMETSGFDLGIFEQAVRGYAEFRGPIADLRGWNMNLYGDHFHPMIATLVPLYWLRPEASTLLVAQAALVALSIVPIARLAMQRLGNARGQAVAVAYGLSWGIQSAIGFDFHEVAFSAPLLAFGLAALVQERWRTGVLFTLALLLVKEDMGLTVAAIGGYLIFRRQWKVGVALVVVGAASVLVLALVVTPHFSPTGENLYLHQFDGAQGDSGGLFGRLLGMPIRLVDDDRKSHTLVQIGLLTGFVALRSPLSALAIPNVAIRFLSDNPLYWDTRLQYNLMLMPIMFVAFLDAYPKLAASRFKAVRWYSVRSPLLVLSIAIVVAQHYPLRNVILEPSLTWSRDQVAQTAFALMAKIPDGAIVETTNQVAPHLTNRCRVYTYPIVKNVTPDWVLEHPDKAFFTDADGMRRHLNDLRRGGYLEVASRDGYVLLRRGS